MGSIKLPNLNNYNRYMYYKNFLPYNNNYWYYYYFYFHLRNLLQNIFFNKSLNYLYLKNFKNILKFKNYLFLGNFFLIYNNQFFILNLNIIDYNSFSLVTYSQKLYKLNKTFFNYKKYTF